jgi:hypothetical protein
MDFIYPVVVILLCVVVAVVIIYLVPLLQARGSNRRLRAATEAYRRALRDEAFAERLERLLGEPAAPAVPPAPPKPSGAPLRLLALLQREGRLLDFLTEDIQAYGDADVGAAVRDIHRQCKAALQEHLVLEPVLSQAEGSTVEVPAGFDPSAIRLTGNVTGQPPFRGTLNHPGWRAKELKLAAPPEGQDEFILMPAEVELP